MNRTIARAALAVSCGLGLGGVGCSSAAHPSPNASPSSTQEGETRPAETRPAEAEPTARDFAATEASPRALALSVEESDRVAELTPFCTVAVKQASWDRRVMGCACCPPFEECVPKAPPVVPDRLSDWVYPMRGRYQGHFLRSTESVEAVVFEGCEPGTHNRGGTMIYEQAGGVLSPLTYFSGINPDRCVPVPMQDAHDKLACLTWGGMGSTSYELLELFDFRNQDEPAKLIAEFVSTVVCLEGPGPYAVIKVQEMEVERVAQSTRLLLHALVSTGTSDEAQLVSCAEDNPYSLPDSTPARRETFVFELSEDTLAPDPSTLKLLEALKAPQ